MFDEPSVSDRRPINDSTEVVRAGPVVWLYGRPSAGKSTVAAALKSLCDAQGRHSFILDGDELRTGLSAGLGFSMEDRTENLRRAAEVAKILSNAGVFVIAAFITPMASHRELIASILAGRPARLVYLDCSHEECARRDVKGHYQEAALGNRPLMTGVGSSFEPPLPGSSDEVLSTTAAPAHELAAHLYKTMFPK